MQQSTILNEPNTDRTCSFVSVAAVVHPSKLHVGVYATEADAARAYDRALVSALGIEAAPLLNFQLLDYLDLLGESQSLFYFIEI